MSTDERDTAAALQQKLVVVLEQIKDESERQIALYSRDFAPHAKSPLAVTVDKGRTIQKLFAEYGNVLTRLQHILRDSGAPK